jgi:hypothetical protein
VSTYPSDFSEVRDEVVRLRCNGHSMDYIATALGLNLRRVKVILDQEFVDRNADRQQLKQQAAMELDYLRRELWREWEAARNKTSVRWAAEAILKAWDQKRRLFALDDPVRVAVTHSVEEMTLEEVQAELLRIEGKLPPALPPADPTPVADAEFEVKPREKTDGS